MSALQQPELDAPSRDYGRLITRSLGVGLAGIVAVSAGKSVLVQETVVPHRSWEPGFSTTGMCFDEATTLPLDGGRITIQADDCPDDFSNQENVFAIGEKDCDDAIDSMVLKMTNKSNRPYKVEDWTFVDERQEVQVTEHLTEEVSRVSKLPWDKPKTHYTREVGSQKANLTVWIGNAICSAEIVPLFTATATK